MHNQNRVVLETSKRKTLDNIVREAVRPYTVNCLSNRGPSSCFITVNFALMALALFSLFAFTTSCSGGAAGMDNNTIQTSSHSSRQPNVIVILTDDQGYADVSIQGVDHDVQTPNIDRLAQQGVRMTAGYVTAPQCAPSRAGLMTGQYQQRFGMDSNYDAPLPLSVETIGERLQNYGYATGLVGKWHLDIGKVSIQWFNDHYPHIDMDTLDLNDLPIEIRSPYFPDSRGFGEVFSGAINNYWRNFDFNGQSVAADFTRNTDFRVEIISQAALAFIDNHKADPFFLVVSYFAPHVPLQAPQCYFENVPSHLPERRCYALAMLAAVDTGVGEILNKLIEHDIENDTLLFFLSDNGAPLGITMDDVPVSDSSGIWDGSLNEPWIGEKGMLSEAGIRVPFILQWKGTLPEGAVYDGPVSALDIGSTALSLAGADDIDDLDGIDLIPVLTQAKSNGEARSLFWRFWNQAAVRKGQWKYLVAGEHEFLFDLNDPDHEGHNLITSYPDIASGLKDELSEWTDSLAKPGLPQAINSRETLWYEAFFDISQ
jgi:arylsulfatase A-like enzyme